MNIKPTIPKNEIEELLERLAALTPRPRINLLLYYGVLGARSAWRSRLRMREPETPIVAGHGSTGVESSSWHPAAAIPPRTNCRILSHLGLPTEVPDVSVP